VSGRWPKVKLGEVLRLDLDRVPVDPSQTYPMVGVYSFGRGLFDREPIEAGKTSYRYFYRLNADHVVMSQLFGWEGALAISSEEYAGKFVSPQFPTFFCDDRKLDRLFLYWLMKRPAFWEDLGSRASGMGDRRRTLNPDAFFACEIPLPPLAEQRRIAARIEALAAKIAEARSLRQQAAGETGTLYPAQLSLTMTPHGAGWKRETVADVIQSMDAGWSPQCDDVPAGEGEWGVLKTTSVQWCDFQPQYSKALPPTLQPIPELAVKEGDVLVTRAGPRKRVAVVAAVRRDEPRLTISDKLIRLQTNCAKIEPRFLELSLASPFSQEHLVQRKTGLADAQVNISQAILKATPVAYPPLPEQRRMVTYLDALQAQVDTLKKLQAETVAELDALLRSILDKAFRGEV
jgi:type I restriction enzyme, S subunit